MTTNKDYIVPWPIAVPKRGNARLEGPADSFDQGSLTPPITRQKNRTVAGGIQHNPSPQFIGLLSSGSRSVSAMAQLDKTKSCRTRSSSSRHANGAICIAGCRVETERSAWTAIIFKHTSSFIGVRHPSDSICNGDDEPIKYVLSGLHVIPILRSCTRCGQQNPEF